MKRTAIQRKTRLRPRRERPRTHKFIVRLTGNALKKLRLECFVRDFGRCNVCGRKVFYEARFPGDPLAYDMAHVRSRGAGGDDSLENVRTLCHECHMAEHTGRVR